jgi:hypothetical protein
MTSGLKISALSMSGEGTSFTRAVSNARSMRLLAAEVCSFCAKIPQGLKPAHFPCLYGTAEAVPFPNPRQTAKAGALSPTLPAPYTKPSTPGAKSKHRPQQESQQ